jgi:16S rRNA (guanine966-N2)-methyltransferase
MRIIAGELRGRRISAPAGLGTRPMLDRVREALFSALMPRLPGALVLDLFAGSGSLGLEAVSRGAREVRFVESDQRALVQLRANVQALGVADRVEIVAGNALSPAHWPSGLDVAFLDPPYALLTAHRSRVLDALGTLRAHHLRTDGVCVLHVRHGALAAPDLSGGDTRVRRYGTSDLWFVEP